MALSPRLLSWVLLFAYWAVAVTEAHLSPHRRQLVIGKPSKYRPIFVPTQTDDLATPTGAFNIPISDDRAVDVNAADIVGDFLSNTEGGDSGVTLVSTTDSDRDGAGNTFSHTRTDESPLDNGDQAIADSVHDQSYGTGNTLLHAHTYDSPLDNGDQVIDDSVDDRNYKVDTGIISGLTDIVQVGVTGHGVASAVNTNQDSGNSNAFGNSLLDIFLSVGSAGVPGATRPIRRSVEGSRHGRRYLRKVRYVRERRQDLLGIGDALTAPNLLGNSLGSTTPAGSSPPSTGGAPPAPEAASSTSGAAAGDSSSSQSAPVAAGPGVVDSNSQTDSASSASPPSPVVAGADAADSTSQDAPSSPAASPSSNEDTTSGVAAVSSNRPSSTTDGSTSEVNAGDTSGTVPASASADPSGSTTGSTSDDVPSAASADTTGADSNDRDSSIPEEKAIDMLSSATGAGRTGTTVSKTGNSPRRLSRTRRGLVSFQASPGVPATRRQLYHPRRGSESRRARLSPRYMHRTRPYYHDRRQDDSILPSQVDGDFDSDMNTLGDGLANDDVPTDDVSGSLGNLLRRYLPSWMDLTKRQDDAIVQADEEVDQSEKDVDDDISADVPDDGARSLARRFYAKVGNVKPRQDAAIAAADEAADRDADALDNDVTADIPSPPSARRDLMKPRQDAAIVEADEAADRDADALDNDVAADVDNPPNARRGLPHPKMHLTETNTRRQNYETVQSDPGLFEEEWLDYARRALPRPKGTISYNHRRDGTGQWAVSSGDTNHLSLSRRYPPFMVRRQETITDVNDDVERDEQDVDGDLTSDVPAPAESTTADRRRQETVTEVNDDVEADEKDVDNDLAADEPHPDSPPSRSFAGQAIPHPKVSVTNLNGTRPAVRRQEREDGVADDLTSLLGTGISVPPDNLSADIPPSLGSSKSSSVSPAATPTPTDGASNTTTEDDLSAPDI